jgi:regulator of protease activity HflC (stomatin/prohibitin superfamily)
VNEEFVRLAETAIDKLNNGIEELEVASSDVSPDVQAALDEQMEVLQEQQQAASQTLDQLRGTSGEMQPYLQAHFISTWTEIVTSYEAVNLLLILDAAGEAFASLRNR